VPVSSAAVKDIVFRTERVLPEVGEKPVTVFAFPFKAPMKVVAVMLCAPAFQSAESPTVPLAKTAPEREVSKVRSPEAKMEEPLMVLILVPETKVSCFEEARPEY